jgi:hypothetical protein
MPAHEPQPSAPSPDDLLTSRARVWFALLGGAVAWTLQLMLAYIIAEFGCLSGLGEKQAGGLTVVAWLLLGLSAAALALAAGAAITAARIRRNPAGPVELQTESALTLAFSGRLGVVTNLVFLVIIAVQSVPIFYFLRNC